MRVYVVCTFQDRAMRIQGVYSDRDLADDLCDRMMRNRTIRAWIEERELNGL